MIRGAKDLDKTFAFVHWAYGKDQQAMVELETRNSSMFTPLQDQRSLTAGHLPILEGMRHRCTCIYMYIMLFGNMSRCTVYYYEDEVKQYPSCCEEDVCIDICSVTELPQGEIESVTHFTPYNNS